MKIMANPGMMRTVTVGFAIPLRALLILGSNAFGQTAREVARTSFRSVVSIEMQDGAGYPMSFGSGFFVEDEVVASNFHVVEGTSKGTIKISGKTEKVVIKSILASDQTNDLVLLKVPRGDGPPLKLAGSSSVEVGDEVFAVGSPHGLEGTFSQGIVSAFREHGRRKLIQITAPISPGSSGGPILNAKAEVVGVATAYLKDGQNLNFAVSIEHLRVLLKRPRVDQSLELGSKPIPSNRPSNSPIDVRPVDGITPRKLEWGDGSLRFSLFNSFRVPVKRIRYGIVFYDEEHIPLEFSEGGYRKTIPAGLATWSDWAFMDKSTAKICDGNAGGKGSVQVRILSFEFAE